ncbi:MAG TPA: Lrp/AsnC family transcriptional regulator [Candidatus Thermoplasmatota archaeon]|nr:Lrp/AsnC family transcriptional regulator [Candidatus Thermoplasmatota archaeon]
MDKLDAAILRALVEDGRATLQDIAEKVGLRRPSVHARVKKLEAEGVIRGYHADVDPEKVEAGLTALVFLRVAHGKGNDCMAACGRVGDALRKIPEVVEFHTLAGDEDAVAKVRAKDVRDLERLVMKQVSGIAGVERVRTAIVLSTHMERPLSIRR